MHFGSRLAFLPDGSLLFTVGERGDRDRAQSFQDHAGKTLRILEDGAIPQDNPFVGRSGTLPEIYTCGHRNAQGMAVQPGTGLVWQHEHGRWGGDEVNLIEIGRNYGWPLITYGREYSGDSIGPAAVPGLEQPVLHWTPSIAPRAWPSTTVPPSLPGAATCSSGALAGRQLRRLVPEGRPIVQQETLLTDERNGELLRLEPIQ